MSSLSTLRRTRSSSQTSYLTTPDDSSTSPSTTSEAPSPTPSIKGNDEFLRTTAAPFEPRSFYDETLLPAIPNASPENQGPSSLDAGTPDHWITRDDRMVRLTGKHPFNSEAPLSALFSSGFLTPQSLFYVRNHGAVPKVSPQQARDWKLRVHGLVEQEIEFTIQNLKDLFPVVTLPVTLVCAGNRRKEQNIVAKGLGFNWGAAGVSTGLFTGVYLADVLEYCRVKNPLFSAYPSYDTVIPGRARHVIFEGADELPKGKYGTSQRLGWAMDREKGMILAWGLNGEDLAPDHGFPLRLVVPGQIGGRMVKWLQRIEVSDRESQHYLHFFDNKLLPTQLTADQARTEMKWWYDPKYIINDLNVNAAICYPDHDHILQIASDSAVDDASGDQPARQILPVQGYAYTGGGRRITRVEVTLDDGQTWQLAAITYPEDLYRIHPIQNDPYFGELDLSMTDMSFSWCFWRLDIDVQSQLIGPDVRVMAVRAIDESLQTMPRDMYWTAMSMMNSWWFRVAVHKEADGKSLRFEHPAPVAGNAQGWMQRMSEAGLNPRYPNFGGVSPYQGQSSSSTAEDSSSKQKPPTLDEVLQAMKNPDKSSVVVTAAELEQHSGGEVAEPWFVVHGQVYDGTPFLEAHPGGEQSIRLVAGEDATEDFMAIHSIDGKRMLRDYHIGSLEESINPTAPATGSSTDDDPTLPFLDPKRWKATHLVSKTPISHDTRMFRFALSHDDQFLGLPVGQHVFVRVKKANKTTQDVEVVQRAYTPYSGNSERGFLEILIKVYFPSTDAGKTAFAGGKMTMLLEDAPLGAGSDEWTIELKGPIGHFTYLGNQEVMWKPAKRARKIRKLAMIAGGSGITPIWATLKAIADECLQCLAERPEELGEQIQVWVVFGNRMEEDILLREELDGLSRALKDTLKIWYVLSSKDHLRPDWDMGRGHVDLNCLREHLPPPPSPVSSDSEELEDTLALVCGPPPMEKGVTEGLRELGWDIDRTVVFF